MTSEFKNLADKVLEDLRLCSYEEWENCIRVLGAMIDTGAGGQVTLNGNVYTIGGKTGLAAKLTGVCAVAGSDSWTYGDHMLNVAVCSGLANVSQAQNASKEQVMSLKNAFVAYAKALDLKTTYAAGDSGHLTRSADMINATTNVYDAAITKFAESKAVFFKNGNWTASSIAEIDSAVAERLTLLPVKLPIADADIHVEGLTASQMNSTIPVFASMYYVINNRNDDAHKKAAQDLTTVSNALGNSIIKYVNMGGTLSNPYNGAPSNWGGNTVGTYILQNYLAKPVWDENDYNKIADYAVSQWVSMGGLE